MSVRLPSHVVVAALLRRVNDAGGFAAVRASWEPMSGAILVLLVDGRSLRAVERMRGLDDRDQLIPAGPTTGEERAVEEYWQTRRSRDPDLWVVELDIPHAERFVAETILA